MTREGTKKRSHKYEIGFEIRQSISVSKCGQGRLIKILCFLKEFCVHALQAFIALDLTNDHCVWEVEGGRLFGNFLKHFLNTPLIRRDNVNIMEVWDVIVYTCDDHSTQSSSGIKF